ncbi:ribonuclease H-like domain-containing protein [Tanacetum coccineum]
MLLCEWVLRPHGHPFDPYTVYSRFPTVFSLKIHHGGELSKAPGRFYNGGKVHWFDQIDSDGFSVVEVTHMLAGLGYVNPKMKYWYKMPDKDAFVPLSNDSDVLRFTKYVDRFKLMQLYVVHPIDKPKPLGDNENPETEETFDLFFCDLDPDVGEPSEVPNVGEHNEVPNVGEHNEVPNVCEPNEVPNVVDQTKIPNDAEHSDGSEESDDSDDTDFNVDLEDRIEDVEVDIVEDTQLVEAEVFEDLDLEDFDSASDPDDIDSNRKKALKMLARKHKPVDGNIYSDNFYCGQTFANKKLIKGMVSRLAVENRRQLWLSKNDKFGPNGPSGSTGPSGKSKLEKTKMADSQSSGKPKVVVKDSQACPWLLHCSKSTRKTLETIKPNPKIPIAALKDQLQKKFELGVSKAKMFRAKQMAQDNVIEDYVNQYARLKDYALELQEQNPDTTIKIDVERTCEVTSDTRKFRRIYVCLGALKSGFKAGKRDLLGLDGCFMSGPYPGHILTAVGVDPNNGTYPLAYAVVEAETKDSWTWFLDCLGDDLQLVRNSNFTFIADRKKVVEA